MKTTILLTGSSGFIGRNLKESPALKNYQLLTPTHAELDLTDFESVQKYFQFHSIYMVIHAAGKPGHRVAATPDRVLYENTMMFLNLYRNRQYFTKCLMLGSGAIYDQKRMVDEVEETDAGFFIPKDEHGLNRLVCYLISLTTNKFIDLRCFGIFGPYEDYRIRFISNLLCKALFDLPLTMNQDRRFSFLDVKDLGRIIDHFIRYETMYDSYNIVPTETLTLDAIAKMILKITKKDLPLQFKVPGMAQPYVGNNSRLLEEMPHFRFTPLTQSITSLWQWYKVHKAEINPEYLIIDKAIQ